MRESNYDKFDSQCDKTMVGFVQKIPTAQDKRFDMRDHNIRCFTAEQIKKDDVEKLHDFDKYRFGKKSFKDVFITKLNKKNSK